MERTWSFAPDSVPEQWKVTCCGARPRLLTLLNKRDIVCAAAPVDGVDQRGAHRPIGKHYDIGAYAAGYLFLPLVIK